MYPLKDEVRIELKAIFTAIANLKALSKDKKAFTIDGRLVGDIGEIVAEFDYNLELAEGLTRVYDAVDLTDRSKKIQIKATFQNTLGYMAAYQDIHYLGLKLNQQDGTYEEIYNGPASVIHNAFQGRTGIAAGKLVALPVARLLELSATIPDEQRVLRR